MSDPAPARRVLLVHAHPDDEVLTTGGVMAKHSSLGDAVSLVTCTLGEEGEVLLPEISHFAADQDDRLGEHRIDELAQSMQALGITDHRILGGAGRYRDSGMMGTPANERAECFWRADLLEAANHLVAVIREVRPHVLITYDDFGAYGHPDHIQAHRVAMYAAQLAAVDTHRPDLGPGWDIPRILWTAMPKSMIRAGIIALRESGDDSPFASMDPDQIPFGCADDVIDITVDVTDQVPAKVEAMRAHASQIDLSGGFFGLAANGGNAGFGFEHFRVVKGGRPPATADDIFAAMTEFGP